MADNLKGIPISSLPKADELVADDQLIAYREDNGKAYRANVGTLGEAAESNLSDAFSTSKTYSAGDYVIYNDTLWKFTADKDAGEWDESVVEKTTMGTEIGEINQSLTDLGDFTISSIVLSSTAGSIRVKNFVTSRPFMLFYRYGIITGYVLSGSVYVVPNVSNSDTCTAEIDGSDLIIVPSNKTGFCFIAPYKCTISRE